MPTSKSTFLSLFILFFSLNNLTFGQTLNSDQNDKLIRKNKDDIDQLRGEFDSERYANNLINKAQNDSLRKNFRYDRIEQDNKISINSSNIKANEQVIELINPKLDSIETSVRVQKSKMDVLTESTGFNKNHMNRFWMLLAAMLVFFMQAGFKVFEVGLVRKLDRSSVGIKNLLDWLVVTVVFLVLGFGLMFGKSNGWIGTDLFFLKGMDNVKPNEVGYEFFLFQLAFAATAVTIISGALAIRTHLMSYIIIAMLIGLLVYPIFGHWVWGHLFVNQEKTPFLSNMGFLDFAGSTVVHSVGAWVALTGMWFIRHRIGKRTNGNKVEIVPEKAENFKPHNLGYSVLGVIILWFGWWGFNGGSTSFLTSDSSTNAFENTQVPLILINTNLSAVFAGLAAFFHSYFGKRTQLYEKTLGGTLGGLVAITACCNVLSIQMACFVGVLAGLVHNVSFEFLNNRTVFGRIIDDPVGAIPVHGACGILGTLCVAFGKQDAIISNFPNGAQPLELFEVFWLNQLAIQFVGVTICFLFTVIISVIVFSILKNSIGIEISREWEERGWIYDESK